MGRIKEYDSISVEKKEKVLVTRLKRRTGLDYSRLVSGMTRYFMSNPDKLPDLMNCSLEGCCEDEWID